MIKTLLIGLTTLASVTTALHAAEIYRWVDERGVTQYSEKPPANRPSKLVDGLESVENFRNYVVKSLYYYPTIANPYITVVTVRGGRVANIDRNRKTF
jgi:hypothetical protein